MIETLISSKTRIKLLLKFFLNSKLESYLRGLETEFGESSNAIRLELNKFEKANLLSTYTKGNKKIYSANTKHPLYQDINNIILKFVGIDKVIESVIEKLGNIRKVYLTGSFAKGLNSGVIDLLIIGNPKIDYLIELIAKVEKLIERKVRYLILNEEEFDKISNSQEIEDHLLLWSK